MVIAVLRYDCSVPNGTARHHVPAYSARHDISVSRRTYGLSLLWPARGVAWPRKHRRMRWRAGMRVDPAQRPRAPTRPEAPGVFFTELGGHISRPAALLAAESVTLPGPGPLARQPRGMQQHRHRTATHGSRASAPGTPAGRPSPVPPSSTPRATTVRLCCQPQRCQ